MSSQERLLKDSPTLEKLYDEECVLEIDPSIAHGFIVLLGGANDPKSGRDAAAAEADLNLAFMAITQGNVVDACFGVPISGSRKDKSPASTKAKTCKELLDDAALSRDPIRQVAVDKYCEAFKEVIAYHERMSKVNCIIRCFRYKKLRRKSKKSLHDTFSELAKAIDEATR